jgi:hypothetical protein
MIGTSSAENETSCGLVSSPPRSGMSASSPPSAPGPEVKAPSGSSSPLASSPQADSTTTIEITPGMHRRARMLDSEAEVAARNRLDKWTAK